VLDRSLQQPALDIDSVTGTSAGAMNAVALAHGLARGGPEEARKSLRRFWEAVASIPGLATFFAPAADRLGEACEVYWNGGYSGNPAIGPLIRGGHVNDLLIVGINPLVWDEMPKHARDIINRINGISFREMHAANSSNFAEA
jgi:predicted acylesterase/phospholipase RssA